jgi:preprotein translocase subunit SecG
MVKGLLVAALILVLIGILFRVLITTGKPKNLGEAFNSFLNDIACIAISWALFAIAGVLSIVSGIIYLCGG